MDTIERYHIYKETKNGTQINDKNTVKPNRIYETIIQGEADRMRLRNRPTDNRIQDKIHHRTTHFTIHRQFLNTTASINLTSWKFHTSTPKKTSHQH